MASNPTASPLIGPAEEAVLLEAATRAPSLHNSQPWQFAVSGRRIEVFADASRHLREADPSGRSLHISCGAALFNLRVAAEYLGFHPRVRVLPSSDDATLVATLDFDHRHGGGRGTLGDLYPAIPLRRTNRFPFRDRTIPMAVLGRLAEAALVEGTSLRVYRDKHEVDRIAGVLHDADLCERTRPRLLAERADWVGDESRTDGIPLHALGPRPAQIRAPFRDLAAGPAAMAARREYATFEQAPTIAVLSTAHDAAADWMRAGQALERVLLVATLNELSASFMNQPLDEPELRWLVRSPLSGVGHSQMVIRLGYGEPVAPTPRRPLDEVRRADNR